MLFILNYFSKKNKKYMIEIIFYFNRSKDSNNVFNVFYTKKRNIKYLKYKIYFILFYNL